MCLVCLSFDSSCSFYPPRTRVEPRLLFIPWLLVVSFSFVSRRLVSVTGSVNTPHCCQLYSTVIVDSGGLSKLNSNSYMAPYKPTTFFVRHGAEEMIPVTHITLRRILNDPKLPLPKRLNKYHLNHYQRKQNKSYDCLNTKSRSPK